MRSIAGPRGKQGRRQLTIERLVRVVEAVVARIRTDSDVLFGDVVEFEPTLGWGKKKKKIKYQERKVGEKQGRTDGGKSE